MAKTLPAKIAKQVKQAVYKKADEQGYGSRTRADSGTFMDYLVADPEVGGVLKNCMETADIRTYIKDGVLNAYTKQRAKEILSAQSAADSVKQAYGVDVSVIQKHKDNGKVVSVCRADDDRIFVVSEGTVLKWETALRKALELVAREPGLVVNEATPAICLQLADVSASITDGDKKHIVTALAAISVKARFCSG